MDSSHLCLFFSAIMWAVVLRRDSFDKIVYKLPTSELDLYIARAQSVIDFNTRWS